MTRLRNKYTVWREPVASLQSRHVGRNRLIERLRQAGSAWRRGGRPEPLYLYGPRGVGKSHLIALVRDELTRDGVGVCWVPEDIPAIGSAEELLNRIEAIAKTLHIASAPRVLVIEGFDKRLGELGPDGPGRAAREQLRAAWDGRRDLWVIGTGNELPVALTDREEPFFGWLDVEPVEPLSEQESGLLLDRIVPLQTHRLPHWGARRKALVALSGGSPRVLVSLAETCADMADAASASDALLAAVDDFTPHYQGRFRDLSAQAQHIAELLAIVPTELNPTEIGNRLGLSPQAAATQTRRMAEDGVLLRREDGRSTWYRVAEPLFRYWFEYRTSPWDATRVGIASRLLEALFSADEIVDAWWRATNPEDATWLLPAVRGSGRLAVRRRIATRIQALPPNAGRSSDLRPILAEAAEAGILPAVLWDFADDRDVVSAAVDCTDDPWLVPTLRLAATLGNTRSPRTSFGAWIEQIPEKRPGGPWSLVDRLLFKSLQQTWGPGKPWTLTPSEQSKLARMPFVRGHLLLRGKLSSHRPVLDPSFVADAVRPADIDLGDVLVAGIRRRATDLVERVLVTRAPGSGARLHANPTPGQGCPVRPDLLVRWACEQAAQPAGLRVAITWARTLADVDDDVFQEFLTCIPPSGPAPRIDIQVALVALGQARPDRLRALVPRLGDVADQMLMFAETLLESDGGHLHAELQRVKDALHGR